MNTAGMNETTNAIARFVVSMPTGSDCSSDAASASKRRNRNSTSAPLSAVRMQTQPNTASSRGRRSIQRDTMNEPTEKPSRKPATISANACEVERP